MDFTILILGELQISGSHGGKYEDESLLEYGVV
jgi:hypothetical protein